jgi:hypothetical protein
LAEIQKREADEFNFLHSLRVKEAHRRSSYSHIPPGTNVDLYQYMENEYESPYDEEEEETLEMKKKRVFYENQRELWSTIDSLPNVAMKIHVANMFGNPNKTEQLAMEEQFKRKKLIREQRANAQRIAEQELKQELEKVERIAKKVKFFTLNSKFLSKGVVVEDIEQSTLSRGNRKQSDEFFEYKHSHLIDG